MTTAFQANAFQNNAFQIDTTPPASDGGGGTGMGWDVGLLEKKRRLELLRRLRFESENEERAELGRYLRELAAGETPATVAMTEAGVQKMAVDSRIATLLARSEKAGMVEFRNIVDQVIRHVQDTIDDEDDLAALLKVL